MNSMDALEYLKDHWSPDWPKIEYHPGTREWEIYRMSMRPNSCFRAVNTWCHSNLWEAVDSAYSNTLNRLSPDNPPLVSARDLIKDIETLLEKWK